MCSTGVKPVTRHWFRKEFVIDQADRVLCSICCLRQQDHSGPLIVVLLHLSCSYPVTHCSYGVWSSLQLLSLCSVGVCSGWSTGLDYLLLRLRVVTRGWSWGQKWSLPILCSSITPFHMLYSPTTDFWAFRIKGMGERAIKVCFSSPAGV